MYGPWAARFVVNALGGFSGVKWLWFAYRGVELAIGIWGLIELGLLRGTEGQNQYGPDPMAQTTVASQVMW